VRGRWTGLWDRVTADEVALLREVVTAVVTARGKAHGAVAKMADEAGVHPYDIRNLINGARPGHWPGLRLLCYASTCDQMGLLLKQHIIDNIHQIQSTVKKLSYLDPDADLFFRHLQRLEVVGEERCKLICEKISGHYYGYRLSRNTGRIIKSHYHFLPFSPYNRLPHVINRLKYGGTEDSPPIARTAQGQVFPMGDALVSIGFVYQGFKPLGSSVMHEHNERAQKSTKNISRPQRHNERELRRPVSYGDSSSGNVKYDGIQINIFPTQQFYNKDQHIFDGVFLSYVYNARYEMGPMKIIRRTKELKFPFDENEVGEFTYDQIGKHDPDLDISKLHLDLSKNMIVQGDYEGLQNMLLATCLSLSISGGKVSLG